MIRDDRRLVQEAFRRTRVLPAADLTRRVRDRVWEERRRPRPDGGWQVAVAGGVLALALVVGLLVEDGELQWRTWGPATPAPSSRTLAHARPSAPGVEPTLLLPAAGGGTSALRRVDWSGRGAGTFTPPARTLDLAVSPDGSLAAARSSGGEGADVVDAAGWPVARLPAFGAWSGDGAHVACALSDGPPAAVVVTDLRDPARPRTVTTPLSGPDGPGPGWTLAGCSAGSDLLVALRQEPERPGRYAVAEVDLVRLSTGRVLSHLAYLDGPAPVAPVLSPDARELAENDAARPVASIRDLATGVVVGHVTGVVVGFSGDGRLVVTDTEAEVPGPDSRAAVVDWRWNRTVWAAAGHARPLAARPGGGDLALSLSSAAAPDAPQVLLVRPDGRALDLDPAPAERPPAA